MNKTINIIMKTFFNALILMVIMGLSSCINDNVGPEGPMGQQGEKGESGYVFEFENVTFSSPEYEVILPFPDNFESLSSDVVLAYMLWDVVEIDGKDTDVWRQLPQTILTEQGMLQYNFDFTTLDVRLFMDAEFDLDELGVIDTDDWVVRLVVVPGDFWDSSRISSKEIPYEELEESLGLPDLKVPKNILKRR
jgi:hypothetical protein